MGFEYRYFGVNRELISHLRVAFYLFFKTSPGAQPFNGNEFDLQDNERARKSHLHVIGCAPRLVLKQR